MRSRSERIVQSKDPLHLVTTSGAARSFHRRGRFMPWSGRLATPQ